MGRISKSGSTSVTTTPNGSTFGQDAAGDAAVNAITGNTVDLKVNSVDVVVVSATACTISQPMAVNSSFTAGSSGQFAINSSGLPTKSNNITLAGQGFPLIVAASVQSLVNAAPMTVSFVEAVVASYRLSIYLDNQVATTITFKLKLTYVSPEGTSRTDALDPMFLREGSSTLGVPANTSDRFSCVYVFGTNGDAGGISVLDNAGTYTTCNYRLQIFIEKLV